MEAVAQVEHTLLQSAAEVSVVEEELDRALLKCSHAAIDREHGALARCFEMCSKEIEFHIHPYQQFASTVFQYMDRKNHLDPITKVSVVQRFLTQLFNRAMQVDTMMGGPGIVLTIKDVNEAIQMLCRGLIKFSELEMSSRCEFLHAQITQLMHLVYAKEKRADVLELKLRRTKEDINKIVQSLLYERGN